jgi:hypothetical protein
MRKKDFGVDVDFFYVTRFFEKKKKI